MDGMRRSRRTVLLSSLLQMLLLPSPFFWSLAAATPDQGTALQEVANSGWLTVRFPSWTPGSDPCVNKWEAVECDTAGNVITLNLSHTGLVGPVPEAVGRLTSLTSLDLGNNKFCDVCGPWNQVKGDLAPLATLLNLQSLVLTSNELDLEIFPKALYKLTKLQNLRVDNTLIRGPFPVQLSTFPDLQYLYLGNNSFTGPLPGRILGTMLSLKELTVWNNPFNCPCPPELGNLVNLTYLNLNKCGLYGGLPPELGQLAQLQRLLLYKNHFTGPIPDTWRKMASIRDFELTTNSLSGEIPPWLLQMPNLAMLRVSNNQFRGTILPVLNSTTTPGLRNISLDCNYLDGSRPRLGNITANLDYNCWVGEGSMDSACIRTLNCLNFQLATSNGRCPDCPANQHLVNTTLCICDADPGGSWAGQKFGVGAVVGVVVGSAVALALLLYCFLWRSRLKSHRQASLSHPDYFITGKEAGSMRVTTCWEVPNGVQRFTIEELVKATNGFDKDHEIGEGGFGKVFVGYFPDGRTLAIKRAAPVNSTSQAGQQQFRNEVLLLSRLHHKNLVRLEGFCDEAEYQILVYEYMKLGNLQNLLHKSHQGKNADKYLMLDWYKRLEIALHVAQGLEYLHSFADPPVIHRDVKPSNILLDDNLVAKVADFGISKESPEIDTHVSTRPAGTAGYFDPQYFLRRQLTTASDVYSFGVVLLELITGRKAIDRYCSIDEETNLIEWTRLKMEVADREVDRIVDHKLEGKYPRRTYEKMVDLALKCASFEKNNRPSMKAVVSVLEPLLHGSERPLQNYTLQPWPSQPRVSPPSRLSAMGDTGSDESNIRSDSGT